MTKKDKGGHQGDEGGEMGTGLLVTVLYIQVLYNSVCVDVISQGLRSQISRRHCMPHFSFPSSQPETDASERVLRTQRRAYL